MGKKQILIVGDSFCAPNVHPMSWHQQLKKDYDIHNLACSGVGQYKIHQQLTQKQMSYDVGIYNITSPNRIHIKQNLFYNLDHPTHSHCDLIYNDVKSRLPDQSAQHITWWFENVFDIDYAQFVHSLIVINDCKNQNNIIPISFFDCTHINTLDILNLESIWKNNQGVHNHLNQDGHDMVFKILEDKIKSYVENAGHAQN